MDALQKAAEIIREADALLICAGAGMGVDSGLPDFRGNEGFWKAYPPYARRGLGFIDMANPSWFHRDPKFAWGFYGHRLNLYRDTQPHAGFQILRQWGERMKKGSFVFTSNVDGQFQKAGFSEKQIIECHGSIHFLQCIDDCSEGIFSADRFKVEVDEKTMCAKEPLPTCPRCRGLARPNILMFGDFGWDSAREDEQSRNYRKWLEGLTDGKLAVVECGAGTGVPTVRYQSEQIARQFRGRVIRINLREPQITPPHISLNQGAAETLRALNSLL